jgi:hypothetical protein
MNQLDNHRLSNGLFKLIKSAQPTLKYEHHIIVAEGNCVIVHERFSGNGGPRARVASDDGILAEHSDVLQDEAPQDESKSGHHMFGEHFAE